MPDTPGPETTGHAHRPILFAAIMLATFMVAMEGTIVATAMPHIVGQLGGFAIYAWVFSAYLLAQCTMTLIFGKLSDVVGRKPVMIAGILVFLAGSLLAGFAGMMEWLVAFRLVQGIGAGAIQPMTITMIGDLYPAEQRARVQGITASVWAGAAVLGPLFGGIIVDHIAWGWVFWINLPIGALTIAGFALFLHEGARGRAARVDWPGAALFAVAIICLLLMLTADGLGPARVLALAAMFAVASVLFVMQELRAPEPMISISLWRSRLMATSNAASLLAGMALVGVTAVLPLYVQGVMGRAPTIAGVTLTTLVMGWVVSLTFASHFFKRLGVRTTLRLFSPALPIGAAVLVLLSASSGPVLAAVGSFGMGMGMGLISVTSIVEVQQGVSPAVRGVATSSIIFSRSLGNALGASVVGAMLALGIAHYGVGQQSAALHDRLNQPAGLADLAQDTALRGVFDAALHWSFLGVLGVAVLAVGAAWALPLPGRVAK